MISKFKCQKIIKTMEKYNIKEKKDSVVLYFLDAPVRRFNTYEKLLNHLMVIKYLDII